MSKMNIDALNNFRQYVAAENFRHLCTFGSIPEPFPDSIMKAYDCFKLFGGRTLIKDLVQGTILTELFTEYEAGEAVVEALEWLGFENIDGFAYNYNMHDSMMDVLRNYVLKVGLARRIKYPFLSSVWLNPDLNAEIATWLIFSSWDIEKYPEGFLGYLGDKPKLLSGSTIESLPFTDKEYLQCMDIVIEDQIGGHFEVLERVKRILQ